MSLDLSKKYNGYGLLEYICWFTESGLHDVNSVTGAVRDKLDITDPLVYSLVQSVFGGFAKAKIGCLNITETSENWIIYPIVDSHYFARFLKMPIPRNSFHIKMDQTVRLSLWHGDNAPELLHNWNGQVIERKRNNILVEYVIQRSWDHQNILASKEFILNNFRECSDISRD